MKVVYKSMKDINDEVEKVKNLVKGKDTNAICTSAKKLMEAGYAAEKKGEIDNAYIYLGRYMNLLTQLQHKADYQAQKNFIRNMLGGNAEQNKIIEKLEKLSKQLIDHFESVSLLEKNNEKPAPIAEEPAVDQNKSTEKRETITSQTLSEMMENGSNKFLIIDCRQNADFMESKIKFKFVCNVPEELCTMGMSAAKIQNSLPNESKVFWEMRKDRAILVFLDWRSTSFSRNSPVWVLRNILIDYDQDFDRTTEMLLLEGGYENFMTTYPMKVTNPHVKIPDELNNTDSRLLIGDIEYPNVEDITMKDESFSRVPSVDRSTKSNAIKSYEHNLSERELLQEKEKIINKSIQNEKEMLQLEEDLDTITANKENEGDPAKERQLLYDIWQMDTKKKDFDVKQEQIDKQLQQIRKPDTISKNQDLEERLKIKEAEQQRIKKDREEKLKFARLHKPAHLDDYKSPLKAPRKNELILSPSALSQNVNHVPHVPLFDRSSKPTITQHSQQYYDSKDFAPVYQKVERGLTGLKNLGNTCYMNSIIQCLSHTLSLTNFLLDGTYEKHINRSNNTKGHIVRTLAAVIKMLWSGDCKYISSKHLKAVIGEQENLFCGMDQQDAHEFLVMLIDWLQSDLQTISMSDHIEHTPSEKAWLEYTKAKESYILRLFYGQIKSTVKCRVCGEESATFDTFSNLSLELPMNNIEKCHIMECFNMYFNGENISGWNCPRCKVPRDAIKKLDISKLPPVLIIHLKRFYADSYSFRKKSIFVEFPYNDLDMLPYVSPKERMSVSRTNHVYNLYAVSNHYGTMESGHYTAFCRNARQKKWYKFDDHNVSHIDKSDIKSSAAYILFYTYVPEANFLD